MLSNLLNYKLKESTTNWLVWIIVVMVALVPAFFTLPYRDNIYLSWEGAYRLYLGQVPFKDFGLPMGYGYWILPAAFFKVFGPYLHTLVKAQVFINIISGIAFGSILNSLQVKSGVRLLSVFLYVISFSFLNFWPWYNHTVIVYEFIGIAFLLSGFNKPKTLQRYLFTLLGALFLFLSFFTKQDGGAFAIMSGFILVGYWCLLHRDFKTIFIFCAGLAVAGAIFIGPLLPYDFSYWFNYGQSPHNSRVSLSDITNEVFGASLFLKLYVLLIGIIIQHKFKQFNAFLKDEKSMLFLLLTLLVLFQAFILQVTSYVPRDGNIYFHSFALAHILTNLPFPINFSKIKYLIVTSVLLIFWWSGPYWKYANRIFKSSKPSDQANTANRVGISSFTINRDTTAIDVSKWIPGQQREFHKIKMPESAVKAIYELEKNPLFKDDSRPKVLHKTEYRPLASIMGYELEKGLPFKCGYV